MGFMDPEGPEEPRTYWIRRAVVTIPVLLVIVALIVLVTQLGRGGSPTTAEPPQPTGAPSSPTLLPADPTTAPTPSSSPTGDPSRDPSGEPSADPSRDPSGDPSKEPKPSDPPSSTESPTSTPKPTPPPKPAACDPGVLRTTLTGPKKVQPEKKVTFEAGVINGGKTTCTFTLDPDSYVFRVYSGTDQIWTTKDCATWLPKVDVELEPEEDVTWKIDWTVQRSKGCDLVPDKLKPGTYAANSLLEGAPPAQQIMQLTD